VVWTELLQLSVLVAGGLALTVVVFIDRRAANEPCMPLAS